MGEGSVAHVTVQEASVLRDGLVEREKLPVAADPPNHAGYNRLLWPFFSLRGVARWQPLVRNLTTQLIDVLVERGHCDLVTDLAIPPLAATAEGELCPPSCAGSASSRFGFCFR